MPFIYLVFITALILESLGSYISVLGFASQTSIIIIAIAVVLDFVKIIIASILYKKWKVIPLVLKVYFIPVLLVLMFATSAGAFGYLTQEFNKTILSQQRTELKLEDLNRQREKLESRKSEIDRQIAQLPADSVVQRTRLTGLFNEELKQINTTLIKLDEEIPKAKLENVEQKGSGGSIGTIAKTLSTTPEQVIKVICLIIVLIIDPLAIVLLTVGNLLLDIRNREKNSTLNPPSATAATNINAYEPEPVSATASVDDFKRPNTTMPHASLDATTLEPDTLSPPTNDSEVEPSGVKKAKRKKPTHTPSIPNHQEINLQLKRYQNYNDNVDTLASEVCSVSAQIPAPSAPTVALPVDTLEKENDSLKPNDQDAQKPKVEITDTPALIAPVAPTIVESTQVLSGKVVRKNPAKFDFDYFRSKNDNSTHDLALLEKHIKGVQKQELNLDDNGEKSPI